MSDGTQRSIIHHPVIIRIALWILCTSLTQGVFNALRDSLTSHLYTIAEEELTFLLVLTWSVGVMAIHCETQSMLTTIGSLFCIIHQYRYCFYRYTGTLPIMYLPGTLVGFVL